MHAKSISFGLSTTLNSDWQTHPRDSLVLMAHRDGTDEPKQTTPAGLRIPIPTREDFERLVKKVAPSPAGRKRPDETDEPPEQSER